MAMTVTIRELLINWLSTMTMFTVTSDTPTRTLDQLGVLKIVHGPSCRDDEPEASVVVVDAVVDELKKDTPSQTYSALEKAQYLYMLRAHASGTGTTTTTENLPLQLILATRMYTDETNQRPTVRIVPVSPVTSEETFAKEIYQHAAIFAAVVWAGIMRITTESQRPPMDVCIGGKMETPLFEEMIEHLRYFPVTIRMNHGPSFDSAFRTLGTHDQLGISQY